MAKILFIRGNGDKNYQNQLELNSLRTDLCRATLNSNLRPHTVEVPDLWPLAIRDKWMPELEKLPIEEYDLIIAHSSGSQAALRLAEKYKIKRLLLIAGHFTPLFTEEKTYGWFDKPFWNWQLIRSNVFKEKIYQICSTNDPYISTIHSRTMARHLNSIYFEIPDRGHFRDYFTRYPNNELRNIVEEILDPQYDLEEEYLSQFRYKTSDKDY